MNHHPCSKDGNVGERTTTESHEITYILSISVTFRFVQRGLTDARRGPVSPWGCACFASPWSFAAGRGRAWQSPLVATFLVQGLGIPGAAVISAAFIITPAAGLLFFLVQRVSRPGTTGRVRTLVRLFLDPPADSGARNGRKVALFQDDAVVQLVARGDEGQGAHGHFFLIGRAAPRPDLFLERTKQADARVAYGSKLLGQARECPLAKSATAHVVILLESGKQRLVAARKPQCPVRKNAFGIGDVSENFLYRPFSRRIPETPVPLASPRKQPQHLQALRFENAQYIGPRNFRYIVRVVVRVFARFRSFHDGTSLLETEL